MLWSINANTVQSIIVYMFVVQGYPSAGWYMTLDSAQVQKGLYEQLLADKNHEAERLRYESETLKLEHKCAED